MSRRPRPIQVLHITNTRHLQEQSIHVATFPLRTLRSRGPTDRDHRAVVFRVLQHIEEHLRGRDIGARTNPLYSSRWWKRIFNACMRDYPHFSDIGGRMQGVTDRWYPFRHLDGHEQLQEANATELLGTFHVSLFKLAPGTVDIRRRSNELKAIDEDQFWSRFTYEEPRPQPQPNVQRVDLTTDQVMQVTYTGPDAGAGNWTTTWVTTDG